jgi:hypothetical protein
MRICACLVFVSIMATAAAADPQPHVRPASADASLAFAGYGTTTQTVRIVRDHGWAVIGVALVDVRRGLERNASFRDAFAVALKTTGETSFVDVTAKGAEPGDYQITIAVAARDDVLTGEGRQVETSEHVLTATVGAPRIVVPAAIHVAIVEDFWGRPVVSSPPILIAETSGDASAEGVHIQQDQPAIHSGAASRGRFDVDAPRTIAPGARAFAQLRLAERFELGDSTLALELTGNGLSDPAVITVSISHRRTAIWVVVLFLVGATGGWLVRTWARTQLELDDARKQARTILDQLLAQRARSRRDDVRKVDELAHAIEEAAEEVSRLVAANEAATRWLREIAVHYAQVVEDLRQQLTARAQLMHLRWIGATARNELLPIEADIALGEAAIAAGNVAAADTALLRIDRRLVVVLDSVEAVMVSLADEIARIGGVERFAPENARPSIRDLNALTLDLARGSSSRPVTEDLIAADAAFERVWVALRTTARQLAGFADTARVMLARHATAGAVISAAASVQVDRADLPASAMRVRSAVIAVHGVIREAVAAVPGSAAKLAEGDFEGALECLDLAAAVGDTLQFSGGVDETNAGRAGAVVPDAVPAIAPGGAPYQPSITRMRRSRRIAALALRAAATLVVLPIAAWWLYGEAFVGTAREMIAITATGFVTDLSLDSALAWLGTVKKPQASE